MASFCITLVFSTSAMAKNQTSIPADDLKTHCNSEGPEIDLKRTLLAPWFNQVDLKLQKQPEYQKLVQELRSQLRDDSIVLCWLKLNKNGDIEKLALNITTGSAQIDNSVENLIRQSAPFDKPAGGVYPEDIQIRIHKAKDLVEISSELNTRATIKARIGQSK